jgi:transposase
MKNLKRPDQSELDAMSHADLCVLIMQLFDVLEKLESRLVEVEKNSKNSSKPPSSDGLKKGAAQPRQAGTKPIGGQKGHQGVTREMVENPDVIEALYPLVDVCECGCTLDKKSARIKERRQQIEIPEPITITTEYRKMEVQCQCGRIHVGKFPSNVTPHVSFGARLKSYCVGLTHGHFVAIERVSEIVNDQYGVQPSRGSIQNWLIQAADKLAGDYVVNQQAIIQAKSAHFDESGLRRSGKTEWLHVATTQTHVHYSVHEKRGYLAMDAAGILPNFKGIAIHDHWKSYWKYTDCEHALCNAHHLRELRYCEQLTGESWAINLRKLLVEGKEKVTEAKAEGKTSLEQTVVDDLLNRYTELVNLGLKSFPVQPHEEGKKGRQKQHEATNLLVRLRDFKTEVWRFITDWHVPFDNNQAERMVRPVKVKIKVIGGFRSVGGSQAFCVIRSIWETNKLNSINPFDTLRCVFVG